MKARATSSRSAVVMLTIFVWSVWTIAMFYGAHWALFLDNWIMSITMSFGSFVAGGTCQGGGAVAFPVMTLGLNIDSNVARDFSLMIQSVGMTAAAFAIWRMRIPVEGRAIVYGCIGGAIGIIVGIEFISDQLPSSYAKMLFVSFWLAFAIALWLYNRDADRESHKRFVSFSPMQAIALLGVGFLGGIVSGITGSGLDITIFSVMVLGFRLDERVATPTSVVLMGSNAVVGFAWKALAASHGIPDVAWDMWLVCVPIVVVGAPFGAWVVSKVSREVVVYSILVLIAVQFAIALLILPKQVMLFGFGLITFAAGALTFLFVGFLGHRRMRRFGNRVPVNFAVQCRATRSGENFTAVARNLSIMGIRVSSERPLQRGEEVDVTFFLPDDTEFSITTHVMRADQQESHCEAGLEFAAMSTRQVDILADYVNRHVDEGAGFPSSA